jgi:hypothetical protein
MPVVSSSSSSTATKKRKEVTLVNPADVDREVKRVSATVENISVVQGVWTDQHVPLLLSSAGMLERLAAASIQRANKMRTVASVLTTRITLPNLDDLAIIQIADQLSLKDQCALYSTTKRLRELLLPRSRISRRDYHLASSDNLKQWCIGLEALYPRDTAVKWMNVSEIRFTLKFSSAHKSAADTQIWKAFQRTLNHLALHAYSSDKLKKIRLNFLTAPPCEQLCIPKGIVLELQSSVSCIKEIEFDRAINFDELYGLTLGSEFSIIADKIETTTTTSSRAMKSHQVVKKKELPLSSHQRALLRCLCSGKTKRLSLLYDGWVNDIKAISKPLRTAQDTVDGISVLESAEILAPYFTSTYDESKEHRVLFRIDQITNNIILVFGELDHIQQFGEQFMDHVSLSVLSANVFLKCMNRGVDVPREDIWDTTVKRFRSPADLHHFAFMVDYDDDDCLLYVVFGYLLLVYPKLKSYLQVVLVDGPSLSIDALAPPIGIELSFATRTCNTEQEPTLVQFAPTDHINTIFTRLVPGVKITIVSK